MQQIPVPQKVSENCFDLQDAVRVIKGLIIDMVEKAKSGHPGGAMSSADFLAVLYARFMRFDSRDPKWPNRDRFILSAGHESALLYSVLTSIGYLDVEELKSFRQFHSKTPGHPEWNVTPGVETSTGPLGQGFANAVGMALGERIYADNFGDDLVNHYTYVLCGDGDIQEGLSSESAELAGHLGLGKLIVFYDANENQIDGSTKDVTSTDYGSKFRAMNWHVVEINGHDHKAIENAIESAKYERDKPTMIIGKTLIARGAATKEGSASTHGAPLGIEEVNATKEKLGLPVDQPFYFPDREMKKVFLDGQDDIQREVLLWKDRVNTFCLDEDNNRRWQRWNGNVNVDFSRVNFPEYVVGEQVETRSASGKILEKITKRNPQIIAGSADLAGSVKVDVIKKHAGMIQRGNYRGRYIAYGVREHAMGSISIGLALYGSMIPICSTFLVFADYMKPSLRMAALMGLPLKFVFTHDSIYVGEDGPTHQPIDQLAMLRAIPNTVVMRPADAFETLACWKLALKINDRSVVMVFSRQKLPALAEICDKAEVAVAQGAYVVYGTEDNPSLILMASGSEVCQVIEVAKALEVDGCKVRVVSMVSWELFNEQPQQYKDSVIPPEVKKRVSVEAASTMGWAKYTGSYGLNIGIDRFGISAPGHMVAEYLGLSTSAILERVRKYMID